MASIRPQSHPFVFEAEVLVELRQSLELSQAKLADLLGVPVNTISRWERGSNVPDANALAAMYSIAKERGVTPIFFRKQSNVKVDWKIRDSLIIQWDCQNMPVKSNEIQGFVSKLKEYIKLTHQRANNLSGVAYMSSKNGQDGPALKKAGFEVKNLKSNADRELIQDGERNFGLPQGKSPGSVGNGPGKKKAKAVYVLIANDGDYTNYLDRLKRADVEVFVCGTANCSAKLVKAVDSDHFIPWQRPYVVAKCYEVARKLTGKLVHKSEFSNQCKAALERDGWNGEKYKKLLNDAGFSINRTFMKVLQHMSDLGVLQMKTPKNDQNQVTLTVSR